MTIFVSWGGSEREVHKERADQTAPPNATLTEPGDRCRTRQGRDSPGGTGQDRQQHLHTYIHTYIADLQHTRYHAVARRRKT